MAMGEGVSPAAHRTSVAARLDTLLARRASGAEAERLALFARRLLMRGGYADGLADDDVAALVSSAYRFYAAPGPELRVRAITPTYASEGWDAPVSILECTMPDRPFIVDTVRERLLARGVGLRAMYHPIFATRRDAAGGLEHLAAPEEGERRESFVHVAFRRVKDPGALDALAADVRAALEDVRRVTDDFPSMVARAHAVAGELEGLGRHPTPSASAAEATAVAEFLRWLVDGGFVFLGYREYVVEGEGLVHLRPGSGLGLLRRDGESRVAEPRPVAELPQPVRTLLSPGRLVTVRKTMAESPVHRRARMDDVAVKALDAEGRVVGTRRFLGLFTSKAYAEEAADIPLLRRMLRQILVAEQVVPGSYDYKEIVAIFNALPKSTLFASTAADVGAAIHTIMIAARTQDVVVEVRPQAEGEAAAVLAVMARDRFSGDVRRRIRDLLVERLGGDVLVDHLVFGEGDRALLHFVVAAPPPADERAADDLRRAIAGIVRGWDEAVRDMLVSRYGEAEAAELAAAYVPALPEEYKAGVAPERAAADVGMLATAARERRIQIALRNDPVAPEATMLLLYVPGAPLVLSECMPVIENLGLRALTSDQTAVHPTDGAPAWVQTFLVQDCRGRPLDADAVGPRLTETLVTLLTGRLEDDELNRLVLEAGLDWHAVDCLRAYVGYATQAGLATRALARCVLAQHPEPARLLFECFAARFRPNGGDPAALRERFVASLDTVQLLRDDLLLRALLDLIEATVRTNAFVDERPEHLALKIRSADVPHLPRPCPLYEIYVHAATMEGIHLRTGKVARGGIRHSDRPDDYRTEVLGLMKTQHVKNAVIVPMGAKGGFVLKGRPGERLVVEGYRTFIRGLLDLTDNLVAGQVVHPRGLVIYDEEDPYLVVAADKGTATFSDVANEIAADYGFWLGDAFASGGSQGYDHKVLGITARGAWECVRTHLWERGLDPDTAPLTVAGIGDMGGDVFGNGLLRSPHLRLQAAFNHRHVFLDPDPDAARSFAERRRLFEAGKGWDQYAPEALSAGGAVIERAAKRATLSPEAQAMLGLAEPTASGERLVRAVLCLDVDLLFNGGIGTYVRASTESDADARDAVNDGVRVAAGALRTRIVAEGGNLGLTQRARIEYALGGGLIDSDAIDNSAGVDMSDHEVNLKICLQAEVDAGVLTPEARNVLLVAMTDDVSARVLAHNRLQSRVLMLDEVRSRTRLVDFRELMTELERTAGLDRQLEALPDRDALRARRGAFLGLTRPELAVVMAYTKIQLQHALLESRFLDDPICEPFLIDYFPAAVVEAHGPAIQRHPLRREIEAMRLANAVVDTLGATFVFRVARDTGRTTVEALRAWTIAWAVAGGAGLTDAMAAGGFPVDVETTCQLVLERATERVTKWVLGNCRPGGSAADVARDLSAAVERVRERVADWVTGAEAEALHKLRSELEIAGLAPTLAHGLAAADWLTATLDVVTVAREAGVDPEDAARLYFGLAEQVDFAWLGAQLAGAGEEDRWQRRAVDGLDADLRHARRRLTRILLGGGALPTRSLAAVDELLRDLRAAARVGLAALQVAVREVGRLADTASAGEGES